jgi:large subunit ribosomal protein L17
MRHRVAGKQLSRSTAHRKALRRNLAASLIEHGAVRTTLIKAKEVRPFVERLITLARRGTLHARRRVVALLRDRAMVDKEHPDELLDQSVVQKLFSEVAPRYAQRPGGYTRIIHLPERRIGDAGRQVLLQLVEQTPPSAASGATPTAAARRKRAGRRAEEAHKALQSARAEAKAAPAQPEPVSQPAPAETPASGEQPPAGDDRPKEARETGK